MEWIYKGQLGETPFCVRNLNLNDIAIIDELQSKVINALEDKKILQPLSKTELEFLIDGNGLMIGAFVDQKLIAFRALLKPEIDEEHLGLDVGIPKDQLERVIYQEVSSVHPDFRGYGLQRKLADMIMNEVETTRFYYVCATVQPFNIASLKDKFSQGMQVGALKYKYGGKLRYVFYKDLREPKRVFTEERTVLMSDTKTQQELLKEGFVGVGMRIDGEQWVVDYKKVVRG